MNLLNRFTLKKQHSLQSEMPKKEATRLSNDQLQMAILTQVRL